MNIICLEDNGGYNLYGAEITKHMKKIFPELKSAFVCYHANTKIEAAEIGNNYFSESDIQEGDFECGGNSILLEFKNGNKVKV